MKVISAGEARRIAEVKNLKPGRVRGTTRVQFTRGKNNRIEVIGWTDFEVCLKKRGLCICESGGFMKIMKQ